MDTTDVTPRAPFEPWPEVAVHLEWGVPGAELAASRGDVVVVVDVLSFSTTLAIAAGRDFTCVVFSGAEIAAMGGTAEAGRTHGATPLSKDRRVPAGQVSLSPASLLDAEPGQRVLFTSLNGAAVVSAAAEAPSVLVGCLRNASACAAVIDAQLRGGVASRVTVVACGEQWSSAAPGTSGWRPALEDQVGAGAICDRLAALGHGLSAEAAVAATRWQQGAAALAASVSARELLSRGFDSDVRLATEVNVSDRVPVRSAAADGREFVGIVGCDSTG